ncbi:bifunctional protein-disulfide isomerase/oxidoreductase DsbC [Pseudoalteromonas tunicata]|jgi:thiol:disulfide interchange protein DsbC|uniref:Thiol:disulfide interchange protein n=1 Tax=Pseudoalteromonas tunicata D2 TaxID=87626 RepID=A4CCI3_9GAMM|nr:bifunctional protein-disulfide isomerase/oxidoreductase DsbC [Pseudoalteromonas tunicata]ATC93777.1 thiol:disulfide interchange protein DsbC [Pseudoalteromonas tunicata]AXT29598.1 bifunctional protein-disulfide isomerase/oxidoreductase DsbC [Pseudoalteromonas tunicata]EAR27276.1 disulfide bond isomerase, periplasmic; chaperone; activated by DsbD; homodimeric [Pseudoalteromonas tunicata D2]MDP4985091.1 bifunctional protein-disulfide isomerase/oxidoreductase DsbC [Pseudoalteromonas tunicata]M
MKKLILALALASFGSMATPSVVGSDEVAQVNPIVAKFQGLGLTVKDIKPSPIAGLKELITDKGVMYASENGQFLIQGTLIDLDNRVNLTEQALSGVRKEGVAQYADSMIVYKAPEEKHQITVFTDITCGYCRKLHREIQDYLDAGITVRYLAFPRGGMSSEGYNDLMNVWCASDKLKALTDAKSGEKVAKVENCNAPVGEHYQLGQSFGINGTPAIILEDGTLIPGYQPAAALKAQLDTMN